MSDSEIIKKIEQFAWNQRRNILEMALAAGADSSHFGGALSIVEITATLFSAILKLNNLDPEWPERDRFILSKGHACLGYYTALQEIGYINKEELMTFEKDGSFLLGHPVINRKKGIEFSTGSLGMGLGLGIGVALAAKKRQRSNQVYTVLGDGECNEGSVWEGAMAAPQHRLDNITCIIDHNGFQQTGSNADIMGLADIGNKFESFGWEVKRVDGHNITELYHCLQSEKLPGTPRAVIANTIKGKGFSFSENDNDWHHRILTSKLYEQGLHELEQARHHD